MNIKGKHLKLCRFIKGNRGVSIAEAIFNGFELNMINSLCYNKDHKKQIIAITDGKLYLPTETQKRI